jgi:hypothetical protein
MGVSIIDGTVESANLKRARRNLRVYDPIVFRLADGSTKTWTRAVVDAGVAAHLVPGTTGRFYLFTAIDHRGVHGARTAAGAEAYGFQTINETAFSFVWVALSIYFVQDAPIIGSLILILGLPAWYLYRKTRLEAEAQFAADAGFRPAAA